MADYPPRRGRDRGYNAPRTDRWDDRRSGRDRDRDRDSYDDRRSQRDHRHRSRSASPRRGRRERSRERRDRGTESDRDRDRDRDRDPRPHPPRGGDRDRDRDRDRRDRDRQPDLERPRRDDRDGTRPRHRDDEDSRPPRRDGLRRDGSPPRTADPAGRNSPLPTRPKPDASMAPLSFRVGKGDSDAHASKDGAQGRDLDARGRPPGAPRHDSDEAMHDDGNEEDEADDGEVDVEADMDMAAMMGFGGFGTTKNTHVKGNNIGAVRKQKKTEYRQYMNRVGGFNRPLSPGR